MIFSKIFQLSESRPFWCFFNKIIRIASKYFSVNLGICLCSLRYFHHCHITQWIIQFLFIHVKMFLKYAGSEWMGKYCSLPRLFIHLHFNLLNIFNQHLINFNQLMIFKPQALSLCFLKGFYRLCSHFPWSL